MKKAFHALKFEYVSLIAIQGSRTYWQKYGLKAITFGNELVKKLASYGYQAQYMELYKPRT